jgi:DNA mismatch repair protein MutS
MSETHTLTPPPVNLTPMMRQYLEIKSSCPDAILFFRLGDFYEMFLEDAVIASRILDITLTSRNKGANDEVPLCGIPYHSVQPYLVKLVEAGYKVAICEQVEDPKAVKGIVRREIVRIVTPGLMAEAELLRPKENNFLLALAAGAEGRWGIALLDLSTGEFRATEVADLDGARGEIVAIDPAELLIADDESGATAAQTLAVLLEGRMLNRLPEWVFARDRASGLLCDFFSCDRLDAFGCQDLPGATSAAGAILHYLQETQKGALGHIRALATYQVAEYMLLDETTRRNLELVGTMRDNSRKGSLLGILDHTVTAMGGRLLRRWVQQPLLDLARIRARQSAIAELVEKSLLRGDLQGDLDGVYDLERLNGKIAMATANAKDLVALRLSIGRLPALRARFADLASPLLVSLCAEIDPLEDLHGLIATAIVDDPPFVLREGGLLRDGFDAELDELRLIGREGKGWIARLELQEKEKTGIATLKVRYNRVFGYYIEVPRSQVARIPEHYQRKQTLANAERYVTDELKVYEEKVLGAEEKLVEREYELFQKIRQQVAVQGQRVQGSATALAQLDVLLGLATVAHERNYVLPELDESSDLIIVEGRHPVVETMSLAERFVPNDVRMNLADEQILIITGPNMAGKSTYMRQVALLTLMAHMGSAIPAKSARIGLVDRIFTRVGASDNLARGLSTFMVEMTETAHILHHATSRSLLVLDEIGRGTSTFDGISIAWAVAEYLHDHAPVAAKTLFATHYHELTDLALTRPRVKNFNIAVREWNDQVIFLRRIVAGPASHSYGIQVARLAGLPALIIERAKEILRNLESGEFEEEGAPRLARSRKGGQKAATPTPQMALFDSGSGAEIRRELEVCDPTVMTPLEALNFLDHLKRLL